MTEQLPLSVICLTYLLQLFAQNSASKTVLESTERPWITRYHPSCWATLCFGNKSTRNKGPLLEALPDLRNLAEFKNALDASDTQAIQALLEKASLFRDQLNYD